jgi:hypothetical protein
MRVVGIAATFAAGHFVDLLIVVFQGVPQRFFVSLHRPGAKLEP